VRENTEGEYSGLEHEVVPGVVEALKVITGTCSLGQSFVSGWWTACRYDQLTNVCVFRDWK